MHVLFVDDQPEILRALERMLEAADVEWDLSFAHSGAEALELLGKHPDIQTIVSDMRMPGMDGAELLELVSKQHPGVIRIVLSGEADKDTVFRAVNPMHRYLAKPCDTKTLLDTVGRAAALRDILNNEHLWRLVGGMERIPSAPSTYQKLMKQLHSDEGLYAIGDTAASDPGIAAKILQIANASVFGVREPVTSVRQAVTLLGLETVKTLALAFGTFEAYRGVGCAELCVQRISRHSLRVAELSKQIAEFEGAGKAEVDEAYAAALLHDIGKLILMSAMPDEYFPIVKRAGEQRVPLWVVERESLGVTHAFLGAYLLSIWGVPQGVVEIVGLHHQPEESPERSFSVLTAVVVSNELANAQSALEPSEGLRQYLAQLNCEDRWKEWRQHCRGVIEV